MAYMWSVDERDGLAESLHQGEKLMQDKQAEICHLEGHTAALQTEISTLRQNKDDVCLCHIGFHFFTVMQSNNS